MVWNDVDLPGTGCWQLASSFEVVVVCNTRRGLANMVQLTTGSQALNLCGVGLRDFCSKFNISMRHKYDTKSLPSTETRYKLLKKSKDKNQIKYIQIKQYLFTQ